jgi:hypothetical protein
LKHLPKALSLKMKEIMAKKKDLSVTVTTPGAGGVQGSFGTEGAGISHQHETTVGGTKVEGTASGNLGTNGKATASYEAVVTTPNGINVSYSNAFWAKVYDLPPAQLISFGNALNAMSKDSAASVRVCIDKNGNIMIVGVDGSASASAKAEVDLTKVDLDKRTNQPITLEGEAKVKAGASFLHISPAGLVLKANVSAEAKGTIDLTKLFKELSEAKFDKKGIAKLGGKAGVTGTVYMPPKFSVDPTSQNLVVHQNIASGSFFYTLKPDLSVEIKDNKAAGWSTTVQVGHKEVSASYQKTIVSDPFSYICSTNQTQQLDALRMDLIRSSGVLVDRTNYRAVIEHFDNPAKPKLQVIANKIPTPTIR